MASPDDELMQGELQPFIFLISVCESRLSAATLGWWLASRFAAHRKAFFCQSFSKLSFQPVVSLASSRMDQQIAFEMTRTVTRTSPPRARSEVRAGRLQRAEILSRISSCRVL